MKKFPLLFGCLFLISCGTLPEKESYNIPLQHFGKDQSKPVSEIVDYKLQPEDVLDVLYHFNTISKDIYRIAPHDKLNVKFLTASEYDDVHQVRPDGYISLPFVGDVKVSNLSVAEVRQTLTRLYQPVLKDPSFFVSLAEYQVHLNEIRQSLNHPNMGQARLVTVREDYKVSFPMLGDLSIHNKTISQLKEEANKRYKEISPGLTVDVLLQESHPKQVYIFGEVRKPGGHLINGPISLFQAVALAGGASHDAELDTVVALSKEDNEIIAQVYNLEDALTGKGSALTAMLKPEDVVYIPRTKLSTTAQVMRHISEILLYRGTGVTFSYRLDEDDD